MELNTTSILDGLNDAQKQAVTSIDGPLLVVAGPGTGKTLTIVRRIAWLVKNGVKPGNILAVTFTNRAAREMKERTEALLEGTASQIFIGTFHLLGLRIIRENGGEGLAVYGRDDQLALLKSLMKGTAKTIQQTADRISRIKSFLEESNPFRPSFGKGGNLESPPLKKGDQEGLDGSQEVSRVYEAYQSALKQRNAMDFDDLIRVPFELLQDNALKKTYHGRFQYIIIDEYQDINPAQYRLLRLLTGESGNICAVGDADQAIYSFRGADPENFLNFEADFPNAVRITLTQNYRSTGIILRTADSVIRNNRKRIEKQIKAGQEDGIRVLHFSVPDERTEGSIIVNEIEARMGGMDHEGARSLDASDRSYRFSDFAVIYRTNAQARALEEAFAASGIPFQVIGKRGSAQRKEIEETLAFLRALAHSGTPADAEETGEQSAEAALLSEADFFDPRAEAVTLMTMHMAKGLEFRVVFIAGCEDGLTPCTIMKDSMDIEEERRLFYVGMTRAKQELFMMQARSRFLYGQSLGQRQSPFLDEIPAGCKETRTIADKIKKQKPEEKQMGLF